MKNRLKVFNDVQTTNYVYVQIYILNNIRSY